MDNKNSYFKPIKRDGNVYLKFFPAQEGGKRLDVRDVQNYLNMQGYPDSDVIALNKGIIAEAPEEVLVGTDLGNPFDESVMLSISMDSMLVWCKFYPGADGARPITDDGIKDALSHEKVFYGVDDEMINQLLVEHEYCTEYLIAKGTPPSVGKDAKIEYYFSTKQSLKPKHNEDGTVNYHELDIISRVEKDQLIARLIPAVPGEAGTDVKGGTLKPRDVQQLKLSFSNNIRISEDGTELYSEVTGHASLVNGKVFVSGVYEVPADVDNSIGDINYPGNVSVKGNVKSGFMIKAEGDIIVDGVVEGAQLYAGGQIIVQRGIHGMGKGLLSARGNIVIKFIEGATVRSGGYIDTESIIQSRVSANTEITVNGGKGFIMGGMVRAGSKITAKSIGSNMGTATMVEVGVEPEKLERFADLQRNAKEISKKIEMIRPILKTYTEKMNAKVQLTPEQIGFVKKQVMALKTLQGQLAPINEEINSLRMEFVSASRAKVMIQNMIYPGVTIKISELSMTTKDTRHYCQFVKDDGEIKAVNL